MSSLRKAPLTGSLTSATQSGTYSPEGLGPVPAELNVSIWGTFSASVRLERSFDGGTTWLPLTAAGYSMYAWTAPASETLEEVEANVLYRFDCTAYTSGTINYRLSQ